jgi:hypothetical protein
MRALVDRHVRRRVCVPYIDAVRADARIEAQDIRIEKREAARRVPALDSVGAGA